MQALVFSRRVSPLVLTLRLPVWKPTSQLKGLLNSQPLTVLELVRAMTMIGRSLLTPRKFVVVVDFRLGLPLVGLMRRLPPPSACSVLTPDCDRPLTRSTGRELPLAS